MDGARYVPSLLCYERFNKANLPIENLMDLLRITDNLKHACKLRTSKFASHKCPLKRKSFIHSYGHLICHTARLRPRDIWPRDFFSSAGTFSRRCRTLAGSGNQNCGFQGMRVAAVYSFCCLKSLSTFFAATARTLKLPGPTPSEGL